MNSYVCHCTVNVYDGVSTLTARPTEVVEADSEQEAVEKVKRQIEKKYEQRGCSVNSVRIAMLKKVN